MDFTIGKGEWFGFCVTCTEHRRGFILMVFRSEIAYAHFLKDHLGIIWTRTLVVGKRKYWLTESWRVVAKKNKRGLKWKLGART